MNKIQIQIQILVQHLSFYSIHVPSHTFILTVLLYPKPVELGCTHRTAVDDFRVFRRSDSRTIEVVVCLPHWIPFLTAFTSCIRQDIVSEYIHTPGVSTIIDHVVYVEHPHSNLLTGD
jgi:hypothetical protein